MLATAVFWVVPFVIDRTGWRAPHGLTEQLVFFFFVLFFGVLMTK